MSECGVWWPHLWLPVGVVETGILLTPGDAAEWLTNASRPDYSQHKVDHFALLMQTGEFESGSPMCHHAGRLEDGHHRTRAVIQSRVSIWVRLFQF